MTRYIKTVPTPKQAAFLLLNCRDAMYGGAAGGGKSEALLMAALQYVDVPGYSAIIFRRSYADLALAGALMTRAHEWLREDLADDRVHWNSVTKTFTFHESGATVTFGYIKQSGDHFRYQGAEFHFIGFDELTQFREDQFLYLFSRLRRKETTNLPLRARCASNPGGIGHEWVRKRYLSEEAHLTGRIFVPANIHDNPHLDRDSYVESLKELDPVTQRQLMEGDWDISHQGGKFQRHWFEIVGAAPVEARYVRYWDLASTIPNSANIDPDWTAGVLMGRTTSGLTFIKDVVRVRKSPFEVANLIRQTAILDGMDIPIRIEMEGGSAGPIQADYYTREVLPEFDYLPMRPPGPGGKVTRANPVSAQAQAGNIKLVYGPWNNDFLTEFSLFPNGNHDDMVDAVSGGYQELIRLMGAGIILRQSRIKRYAS